MATKTYVNFDALIKRAAETYDYDAPPFGTFRLRNLTHGEVKALNVKYPASAEGQIEDFQAFIDEITCMACVEPALTPETLDQLPDENAALRNLGLHIGRRCNILVTPKDEEPSPKPASDPPSNSSS